MRRVAAILFAVVLTGIAASPAMAQLFTDDFTGVVGDSLSDRGYVIRSGGTSNAILTVGPGLTFGNYAGSGIGNAAKMKVSGQDLTASFQADSVGSLYMAFMLNISTAAGGDYFIGFTPTTNVTNYTGRFYVKTDSAGGYFVGTSKNSEGPVYGTTHFMLNTTYLMVFRFFFLPGDTDDVCVLYTFADGNVPATEPEMPEVVYDGHSKTDPRGGFSGFVLRQGGGATLAPVLTIDGIRIDTTWAGVLGIIPQFSVAPKALDFGTVSVDSTKTDTLTVTNGSATNTLLIDSVRSTNPVFTVYPANSSISPSSSADFIVTYHPLTAGSDTGSVVFYYGGEVNAVSAAGNAADMTAGITPLANGIPNAFALERNFPNPFNPSTTIQYALPVESQVTVKIYSTLGQEICTVVSEIQKASYYRINWNGVNAFGSPVSSGFYFCRFTATPTTGMRPSMAPFMQVQKMLLLK